MIVRMKCKISDQFLPKLYLLIKKQDMGCKDQNYRPNKTYHSVTVNILFLFVYIYVVTAHSCDILETVM